MEYIEKVINQDINVALDYFKIKKFDDLGIIGNRLMSNLVIGERDNLIFLGYLLREIATDYKAITINYETRLNECMDIGTEFIQQILNFLSSDETDIIKIWEYFFEYEKKIIKFISSDIELSNYDDNIEFSQQTTNFLMNHLEKNKHMLLLEDNALLIGISNEISRVINTHGFSEKDLMFYLLLRTFVEYYIYIYHTNIVKEERDEEVFSLIYPFIDKIINLPDELDELCEYGTLYLNDIGYKTRILYFNFLDPSRKISNETINENQFKMPKKSKDKIGKMIKKAIEKEVK